MCPRFGRLLRSKPCSYSFLTQGNSACEKILRAELCTAVRTGAKGAHISLVYCVQRSTDCIFSIRYKI